MLGIFGIVCRGPPDVKTSFFGGHESSGGRWRINVNDGNLLLSWTAYVDDHQVRLLMSSFERFFLLITL